MLTEAHIPFFPAWAITPAFFWAGAALIGIPILIHLLNRRRYKVITWAAMEYLLSAMRKNRRRIKFEQMVLLATRCSILALLGLALARPLGCQDNSLASFAGARSGLHVFVIDNSYSMAYEAERPDARTHLDQAKILARLQIDKLVAGSESVLVITAAAPVSPDNPKSAVIARPSYDLKAAQDAIDRVEQSYSATDIAGALQLAIQLAREDKRQPTRFLYVLTDFTRSAWQEAQAEVLAQTGRELAATFGPRIRFNNLGKEGQWNYAVRRIRADSNLVTNEFDTDFFADVKGFGAGPETLVQWKWDEIVLGSAIKLTPDLGTIEQRQSKAPDREGGVHVLSVSLLNDERLKVDNMRWRAVEVASELKVLIVEGERGTSLLSGSGAFLDLALAPKKEIGSTGAIRSDTYVVPELISDLELGNKVLSDYRAVLLTNVSSLSPGQADQIEKFVRQGGTLMLFMGEQVNADAYNSILLPRGLMPGRLVARKTSPDPTIAFTLDFKPHGPLHPLLDIFRGVEDSGLNTTRIFTYLQAELEADSDAEIVLGYLSGDSQTNDPAITVHPLGRGRIVFFSTTADADWTHLPGKPAYTALMHSLLTGTVDVGDKWMNLEVGRPLAVPPALRLTSAPVLADAARKEIPLEAVTEAGQTFYRSPPLELPGMYHLRAGDTTFPVVVNVPAEEADIRLLPPEEIRKRLGDIDMQTFGDLVPADALAREDSSDLGWMIMLLVLALVGAECFMAMRFGHYRRKSTIEQMGAGPGPR